MLCTRLFHQYSHSEWGGPNSHGLHAAPPCAPDRRLRCLAKTSPRDACTVARTSDDLGRRADHIVGQTLWALSATQNATHGRVCAARTQGQVWVHLERTNTATQVRTDSEEGSTAMAVTDSALYFLHVNGTLYIYSLDSLAEPPVRLRAHAEGHVALAVTLRALPGGCRCFH